LQTQVPAYAELYAQAIAERALAWAPARRAPGRRRGFARLVRRALERQAAWYYRGCARVLVSAPRDAATLRADDVPADRLRHLPRGIDKGAFHPGRRDRAWLRRRLGIPEDEPVALFVGKLMPEKAAMLVARAVAALRAEGERVTLVVCGEGEQAGPIRALLGPG